MSHSISGANESTLAVAVEKSSTITAQQDSSSSSSPTFELDDLSVAKDQLCGAVLVGFLTWFRAKANVPFVLNTLTLRFRCASSFVFEYLLIILRLCFFTNWLSLASLDRGQSIEAQFMRWRRMQLEHRGVHKSVFEIDSAKN
jgi:hypothetical protein